MTDKKETKSCPLCEANDYTFVESFEINELMCLWKKNKGFNPIPQKYKDDILEKRRCSNCGLYFYNYHIKDSAKLYSLLHRRPEYGSQIRFSHKIANDYIKKYKPTSLIEIGSGKGKFLEQIKDVPRVKGYELNKKIAKLSKKKGFKVLTKKLSKVKEQFDIVCCFDVLEHIFDIKDFISELINILKFDGKLIIGLPDPDGILSVMGKKVLSLPPHHQFDFSKKTLDWIAEKFGLEIFDYRKTELSYKRYEKFKNFTKSENCSFEEAKKLYTGRSHVVVFKKISE